MHNDPDTVIRTMYDSVSFVRGYGDSGRRIQIVEHECDTCGYDRMVRTHRVDPEHGDRFSYHCNAPNCPDYNGDTFTYCRPH